MTNLNKPIILRGDYCTLRPLCHEYHDDLVEAVNDQGLFMTKYKPSIVQLFFSQQSTKDLVNLDSDFCLF